MLKTPYIIAEIASAHEGDANLLSKIANEAINSNADAIKFQIFKRDNLISPTNPLFDEFGEIEISPSNWHKLIREFSLKKIDLITEVFDYESLEIIKGFDIDIKVPSASISDTKYLKHVSDFTNRIFLAVGGSTLKEIESALSILQNGKKKQIILQCGFQNFPTKIEDSNLSQIEFLNNKFGLSMAYADHVDAEDVSTRFTIPALAYFMGAQYIEKHITLNRSHKGRDYYSSLNPDEFKEFAKNLRELKNSFGDPNNMGKTDAEIKYKSFSKKYAVAKNKINAGKKCDIQDFSFLRTAEVGISEQEFILFVGKEIKKDLNVNDLLFDYYF